VTLDFNIFKSLGHFNLFIKTKYKLEFIITLVKITSQGKDVEINMQEDVYYR